MSTLLNILLAFVVRVGLRRRVVLPDVGVVRFPLKEEYDRQTRSISGLFEPMGEKERRIN